MKKHLFFLLAALGVASQVNAQSDFDSHQLSLTVVEINEIEIGTDVVMIFGDLTTTGSNALVPQDGSTPVQWTTNSNNHKKITIKANQPIDPEHFQIGVILDDGVSPGLAIVTGTTEQTLLTGIHAGDRGYTNALAGGQATLLYSVQPYSTFPVSGANEELNIEMTLTISDL